MCQHISRNETTLANSSIHNLAHSSVTTPRSLNAPARFEDAPAFRPTLTPAEVLQRGSFGGTYFRTIKSGVTGETYKDAWKEFPKVVPRMVAACRQRVGSGVGFLLLRHSAVTCLL